MAKNEPAAAIKNLEYVPFYGRWDDLLCLIGTPVEKEVANLIEKQLTLDMEDIINDKAISLLAKWLPSENAHSKETKEKARWIITNLRLTPRAYRKTLSRLREQIKVLEKLMSANRWDEIEFSKIPSKAGLIYRNAFARRDMIAEKYKDFAMNKNTKVNADTLYPYEIAHKAFYSNNLPLDDTERVMLNKYWDNLKDYYNGRKENGLCVVDVSGSMTGRPMEAAVSMGAYIAERGHGPFANHFITFSECPSLIEFEGVDIVDKINRCRKSDWGYNTNIEAVFDLLLDVAKYEKVKKEDIPSRLYIFSDMEFDEGLNLSSKERINTLLDDIAKKWKSYGYELPQLIFWNLDARNNTIPTIRGHFAYVSGFSMSMIETILSGKDGFDLMLEVLLSERYKNITC